MKTYNQVRQRKPLAQLPQTLPPHPNRQANESLASNHVSIDTYSKKNKKDAKTIFDVAYGNQPQAQTVSGRKIEQ